MNSKRRKVNNSHPIEEQYWEQNLPLIRRS